MSADPGATSLAAAVAKIGALEAELDATRGALEATEADLAAEKERTAAAADALASAERAAAADAEQRRIEAARMSAALDAANTAADEAHADYLAVSAKFDRMFGDPVEPGIVAFRKYRTTADNVEHTSLELARARNAALRLGVDDKTARELMAHVAVDPGALDALRAALGWAAVSVTLLANLETGAP